MSIMNSVQGIRGAVAVLYSLVAVLATLAGCGWPDEAPIYSHDPKLLSSAVASATYQRDASVLY
jgi:hypothetical protein